MTPVRHIASKPPVTASPTISIREAAEIMTKRRIGLLVLVQGGEVFGVVSERDIVNAVARGIHPSEEVSKIASRNVISIEAEASVRDAAMLIRKHNVRHLVVTSGGQLYGVLSIRDLINESEILKSIAEFTQIKTEEAAAD